MGYRIQLHALAYLTPRKDPCIHCTGGWVGPTTDLVAVEKEKPFTSDGNRTSASSPYPVTKKDIINVDIK
jgi:hypothetical protein